MKQISCILTILLFTSTNVNSQNLEQILEKYYKIRLTTPETDTLFYYINPQTNLIFKMSYSGDLTDGKEHKSVTLMNYKKVQNIFFPFKKIHRSKMLDGTYGERETVINEIRINQKFDKELFNVAHRIINQKN